jgi:hypothetical protein
VRAPVLPPHPEKIPVMMIFQTLFPPGNGSRGDQELWLRERIPIDSDLRSCMTTRQTTIPVKARHLLCLVGASKLLLKMLHYNMQGGESQVVFPCEKNHRIPLFTGKIS